MRSFAPLVPALVGLLACAPTTEAPTVAPGATSTVTVGPGVGPRPGPAVGSAACAPADCNTRGMLAYGLGRHAEAIALLDRGCAAGHAVACSNLAGVFRGGIGGGPRDPGRSVGLYERSCRLGFGEACTAVGTMLAEGTAVPADPPRALAMFELGCARRDAYACFTAGMFREAGRGGPRDPRSAVTSFASACELGHASGCFNAGILLYDEQMASAQDNARAVGFFGRACDGSQPAGCLRLGVAVLRGVGAPADRARAKGLFVRACQGGDEDGCHAADDLAKARGRRVDVALTSRAPQLSMGGLTVQALSCRMPQTDPLALAEAVEGLAAHKAALDACAPSGEAPQVTWSYRGGRIVEVEVRGADAKLAACVRRALERARSGLTASCAATLLIGEPAGARKILAERR